MSIRFLDGEELARRLDFPALVAGLAASFGNPVAVPVRQNISQPDGREFLVMPVADERHAGAKLLTIVPANVGLGQPVVQGLYALFDFETGAPLAVFDAAELTSRRTAAVSALAADRLARKDAKRLLLVGSGNLVPYFAQAMLSIRAFDRIEVWARDKAKTALAVDRVAARTGHRDVRAAGSLEEAVAGADVISCLTGSTAPLVHGAWLRPGTHVDLVGGYRPDMREADDETFARSAIYVDDRDAVLSEAGDILHPLGNGTITEGAIRGDLSSLAQGQGRESEDEITVFKSVGTAAADLFAARVALRRAR